MRIGIDIDSTLHHYWDQLADAADRRTASSCRTSISAPGRSTRWRPTSSTPASSTPTPTSRSSPPSRTRARSRYRARWKDAGHFIHITSHRSPDAHGATAAWLERIGLPYDELYCSYDKVTRCVEIGIDVLIDDSPVNLVRAAEHGIIGATIRHPWNEEVCLTAGIVCAEDWRGLAGTLAEATVSDVRRRLNVG